MKAIAVYPRLSKLGNGDWDRTEVQEQRGREYAAQMWPGKPVLVFPDKGITAADSDAHRQGYEDMLAAIRRGEIEHVVCAEQSRITRQPAQWEAFMVACTKAGIGELHTYRKGIVALSRSRLVGRIMAAVDAEEVETIKLRVNDALAARAADGQPPGGLSYGYRRVKKDGRKTYEPVPDMVEAARWGADAVLSGWSLSAIATKFTEDGIPTAKGGTWTTQTVRSMLTSPSIAGLRVHRGAVVGKGNWPPILDVPIWRAVCAKLDAESRIVRRDGKEMRVTRSRKGARRYLLTGGVAVCGKCGEPGEGASLLAQRRTGRSPGTKPVYMCPAKSRGGCGGVGIVADDLEAHVVSELLDELDKPAVREAFASDEHEERRSEIVTALGEIEQRRSDLARMWAAGNLTGDEWQAARAELDAQEGVLQGDLAAIPAPAVEFDPATLRDGWELLTLDEQREIVGMFIEHVVVHPARPGIRKFDPGRVEIVWR